MSSFDYDPNGKSEVARLMWQIERSCEAIQRVMVDPGFASTHEAIQRRYAALGRRQEQLASLIGERLATDAMCDIYNEVLSRPAPEGDRR